MLIDSLALNPKELENPAYFQNLKRSGKVLETKGIAIRDKSKIVLNTQTPQEQNCYQIYLNLNQPSDKFFEFMDELTAKDFNSFQEIDVFTSDHILDFEKIIRSYYEGNKAQIMQKLAKL